MELIKEASPIFEKKLFLKSLHEYKEGVNFKILKVGNIFKSKMNGKPNFFIDLEILSNFKCEILKLDGAGYPLKDKNGKKITNYINVKNMVIGLPYPLQTAREKGKYNISNKTNLFSLLNHAFIVKDIVNKNNLAGFNEVTFNEIETALTGLEFKGTSIYITKTNYNPYYKLVPITEKEF